MTLNYEKLPNMTGKVKKVVRAYLTEERPNDVDRVSGDAVRYLEEKAKEFIVNLTREACDFTTHHKRRTLFPNDCKAALNDVDRIMRIRPKGHSENITTDL